LVPAEAGWRTFTTPRKVELPSCTAASPKMTTRSAHPTQLGGGRTKPCRRVVLSATTRPGKKNPKRTHARRRPGKGAPSEKHELCDRKFTLPRRKPRGDTHALPSYPVRSTRTRRKPSSDMLTGPSENPPQTFSQDPRKTLPSGPTGPKTRRTASKTSLSRVGGRVLRDTPAAPRGHGGGVT